MEKKEVLEIVKEIKKTTKIQKLTTLGKLKDALEYSAFYGETNIIGLISQRIAYISDLLEFSPQVVLKIHKNVLPLALKNHAIKNLLDDDYFYRNALLSSSYLGVAKTLNNISSGLTSLEDLELFSSVIKNCVPKYASLNELNKDKSTILMEFVKGYLNSEIPKNTKTKESEFCFFSAIEIIDDLISRGVSTKQHDKYGKTVFDYCDNKRLANYIKYFEKKHDTIEK